MAPRRPLALPLPVLLALALSGPAPSRGDAGQGRLRPPAYVTCDRNRLTSYTGRVVSLERGHDRTIVRMETDESTREALVIRHPEGDALPHFRMAG